MSDNTVPRPNNAFWRQYQDGPGPCWVPASEIAGSSVPVRIVLADHTLAPGAPPAPLGPADPPWQVAPPPDAPTLPPAEPVEPPETC